MASLRRHALTPVANVSFVAERQLAPGARGIIAVTLTPSGEVGSTVSGYVYLDTYSSITGTGDELVRVRYSYTVTK